MSKFIPGDELLRGFIDYYWVIEDFVGLTKGIDLIYEFPSLSPELVIVIDGHFNYTYKGKNFNTNESILFSFIDENLKLNPQNSYTVILIKFKNTGLSSLLPFIRVKPKDLIQSPIIAAHEIWGSEFLQLESHLKQTSVEHYKNELDEWFLKIISAETKGFVNEIAYKIDGNLSVKNISEITNSSYSTIERYFKKESGISPKKFLLINRFKNVMEDFYYSRNSDWMEYVVKYNFHDQNHFIKEIKRFSGFTPNQLLAIPGFRVHRPVL